MSQSIEYMCRGLIDGYRDNDPNISDRLVDTQAKRAAELVRRLRRPGVMTLPDPVGTGKTVVALAVAAYLVGDKTVNRILVIAPNDVVARLWCGRAQRLVSHAPPESQTFAKVRRTKKQIHWSSRELRVVTRQQLSKTTRPSDNSTLLVVDEAHRGLQKRGGFHDELEAWAANQRCLLVTATPFQLSTQDLLTMLDVAGGTIVSHQRSVIENYGRAVTRLARYCAKFQGEGHSETELVDDHHAQELVKRVIESAGEARAGIDQLVLPPAKMLAKLPHHPRLNPLCQVEVPGLVRPDLISLGAHAVAHNVARTIPELLDRGKGDMFNRQLVSSAESFWESMAGQALADPSLEVLEAARITGSALSRLSQELRDELGDGKDHPKIAATVRWVASRMNSVPRHHILVFCVFDATRRSLEAALKKELGANAVASPGGDKIPKHLAERFMKEPQDGSDPLVMIVQDRFSESIDLDGGNPYLVHHDLPWNPARISQRWGRVVRAGSKFHPVKPENIYLPVLDTEVDRRLYETLVGRQAVGDILIPRGTGLDEYDGGTGSIPLAIMKKLATPWK
jgi:hypothetical protein